MDDRPWFQHYDPGVPRRTKFEDLTLPQFLERAAARYPNTTAVVFLNGRLTYRQLKDQVDRLAAALASFGVTTDSRVAMAWLVSPSAISLATSSSRRVSRGRWSAPSPRKPSILFSIPPHSPPVFRPC